MRQNKRSKYQEAIDREVRAQIASYFDILLRNIGRIERCPDGCADKLCEYCSLGIGLATETLRFLKGRE